MKRMRQLAAESPVIFSLAATLAFVVMVILAAVVAGRWPAESAGWYVAATAVRLLFVALLMLFVARLGWLDRAGFSGLGRRQVWLVALVLLAYGAAVSAWAMSRSLDFGPAGSVPVVAAAVFMMTHALLEEIVFRGLILTAFLASGDGSGSANLRAVLASSLFFAAMHLVNVLGGNPLPVVLLQTAGAVFLGILLGGLVIYGRSIYPAVVLHGLWNLAVFLNLAAAGLDGSDPAAWLAQSALMLPLALVGLYLIQAVPPRMRVVRFGG